VVLRGIFSAARLIYCLLFGAPISSTDPIAVFGILKSANVPRNVEAIEAEIVVKRGCRGWSGKQF
jgi:NhaP-type Na+/H+ or K+/H+ antiporter